MARKPVYKIIFHNQGKVFEIYAHSVHQGNMFGFIEVEKLIFGEKTTLVVDPSEENLKSEFSGVTRTYIPLHAVIRIDEVDRQGAAKIMEVTTKEGKISPFPVYTRGQEDSS
ncbi:MAG: hypothetical protein A3I78_11800 [Gammaproteobacteria bacterium RIFCSPLOWO2_02_FULL_56_15]|nr:MAG: hypothetical protein A3I78_11800 [Gammaproteobacteria bacterium RIFCSPLOWO2_02_FULL_56_15]